MVRALFLGSGGRIGRLLQSAWTDKRITPMWHQRSGGTRAFDILDDTRALASAVEACDVIINLAGATHHGVDPVEDANTKLARHILDHAGTKPVFLMSSAAVYGRLEGKLSEDRELAPISDYGRDKARMETMAQAHRAITTILRLGNVAGADALLGVERAHYILDRFADGAYPCRSYIGPALLARVLADLILKAGNLPQVLNIATARAVSMADLLHAAAKPWSNRPAGPSAIRMVEMETTLLQAQVPISKATSDPKAIVSDLMAVKAKK